jgi:hypothetical protein
MADCYTDAGPSKAAETADTALKPVKRSLAATREALDDEAVSAAPREPDSVPIKIFNAKYDIRLQLTGSVGNGSPDQSICASVGNDYSISD